MSTSFAYFLLPLGGFQIKKKIDKKKNTTQSKIEWHCMCLWQLSDKSNPYISHNFANSDGQDYCLVTMGRKDTVREVRGLLVSCIIMPSWDVYSDWALTVQLIHQGYPYYALALLVPQCLNIFFTFFMWSSLERMPARRWSWLLVILQCWPQFFAARILWMMFQGWYRHWEK